MDDSVTKGVNLIAGAISVAVAAIFVSMAAVNFGYYRRLDGIRNLVDFWDIFFGSVTFVDFGFSGLFLALLAPALVATFVNIYRRRSIAWIAIPLISIMVATAFLWFPENPGVESDGFSVQQALLILTYSTAIGIFSACLSPILNPILAYLIPVAVAWVLACEGVGFIWGLKDLNDQKNNYVLWLANGECIERRVVRAIGVGIIVVKGDNSRPDIIPSDSILILQKDGFCPPDGSG